MASPNPKLFVGHGGHGFPPIHPGLKALSRMDWGKAMAPVPPWLRPPGYAPQAMPAWAFSKWAYKREIHNNFAFCVGQSYDGAVATVRRRRHFNNCLERISVGISFSLSYALLKFEHLCCCRSFSNAKR